MIYITPQKKAEIKAEIAKLEKQAEAEALTKYAYGTLGKISAYKEILAKSVVIINSIIFNAK